MRFDKILPSSMHDRLELSPEIQRLGRGLPSFENSGKTGKSSGVNPLKRNDAEDDRIDRFSQEDDLFHFL
jgi:hypothetical protein